LVFLVEGGIDVTKSTGCTVALADGEVMMSGDTLMLELLQVKLGSRIGPNRPATFQAVIASINPWG
jgi:hypothetical protein